MTKPSETDQGLAPWRGTANPRKAPRDAPYATAGRASVLNDRGFDEAEAAITAWPGYAATPLHALPGLAKRLGLAALHLKDEGLRFGLGSFKALGGAYAVSKVVAQAVARATGGPAPDAAELLSGRWEHVARAVTVTCATDGNHGRSVAWGARLFGCRCVIVIHATVSDGRRDAIAAYGAEVVRVAGNYDDAVRHAEATARAEGWTVVSDTTYEGYRDIPIDVMHGYGVMAREVVRQLGGEPPTHVVVQAGVGAFAASVAAVFWQAWGPSRPRLVVVEPLQADCHLQSARAGHPVAVTGDLDTAMAGLACGEVSPAAWTIVSTAADDFIAVHDDFALQGMRVLAEPTGGDPAVVAGETGAAGLAVLLAAQADATLREQLDLGPTSRVLLLNSEGDTDPVIYRQVVGCDAHQVRAGHATPSGPVPSLRIDGAHLLARLNELALVGAIDGAGCCRLALTDADRLGRDLVVGWMRAQGLAITVDAIGNVMGVRAGRRTGAPVMTGSHIDTVRTGGRYDGHYGVLAGLEVLRTLDAAGIPTEHPLAVAFFTNEEGARFAPDMLGSLVVAGGLALDDALDVRAIDGARLGDELQRIEYAGTAAPAALRPRAFVELHIEQGPVLHTEGLRIGAVQDLQGISWQALTIAGQSNHAGTTPMHLRRDAGLAAAAVATFVRDLTREMGPPLVGTVGRIELHPNLINVIAARATLTVDLRHTDEARLREAESRLADFLERLAADEQVTITTERLARFEPVHFDVDLVARIERVARSLGHTPRRMTSGAGHDAQMMARVSPSAMIFVPSVNGLSHNPAEHTEPADLVAGADVLLHTLLELAEVA